MRSVFIATLATLTLAACASQSSAPAAKPADATRPAEKAPQCYSGDHGKFFDVGARATVAGIEVSCEKTADGKAAQWMSKKH